MCPTSRRAWSSSPEWFGSSPTIISLTKQHGGNNYRYTMVYLRVCRLQFIRIVTRWIPRPYIARDHDCVALKQPKMKLWFLESAKSKHLSWNKFKAWNVCKSYNRFPALHVILQFITPGFKKWWDIHWWVFLSKQNKGLYHLYHDSSIRGFHHHWLGSMVDFSKILVNDDETWGEPSISWPYSLWSAKLA